ncbi:hypothetical protein VCHA53O466_50079 [Vibrio chagasii]|nr:hypothetical protein VCHA53O466_50079 [Vibrio chagasii]
MIEAVRENATVKTTKPVEISKPVSQSDSTFTEYNLPL